MPPGPARPGVSDTACRKVNHATSGIGTTLRSAYVYLCHCVRGIARYCPRNVWRMIRTTLTPTLTSIPTCAPVEKPLVVPFLEAASLVAVVSENEIGVDVVERAVVL
jgi:hypothetical protein